MKLVTAEKAACGAPLLVVLASGLDGFIFCDKLSGCHLAAIALDRAQGLIVSLGAIGQAGISDLCDQIAQVTGIADGAFHTLVGDQATDHQLFDA